MIDAGYDFCWHGKFSPFASGDKFSSGKVEKFVSSLKVSSGSEADSTNGAGTLIIGGRVLFMNLCVGAKGELTMSVVIEFDAGDETSWTYIGNAAFRREDVDPKCSIVHHLD